MLICSYCQSANPLGHKFCQSCGKPLPVGPSVAATQTDTIQAAATQPLESHDLLQVTLMVTGKENERSHDLSASDLPTLRLGACLDGAQRYEVVTMLKERTALVRDLHPERRSSLQTQLAERSEASIPALSIAEPSIQHLQTIPALPPSVYPYYLLADAAPTVYDAWCYEGLTVVITQTESTARASILHAFAVAEDALNYVYWLYRMTELWLALEAIPQWRSSLLLADHLGIDEDQSVRVRHFANPGESPPKFAQLKAFLSSLLAQANRASVSPRPQIQNITLAVSSATTLQQLRDALHDIGEFLLDASPVTAPSSTATVHTPPTSDSESIMEENTSPPINSVPLSAPFEETVDNLQETLGEKTVIEQPEFEEIEFVEEPSDGGDATMVLPMKLVDIEEAGRTDVGRQRDHNEDCFFISSSSQKQADNNGKTTKAHSLYVLCDGMGGHEGGEVASRLAAETLANYFNQQWPHPLPHQPTSPLPSEEVIATAVRLANQAIFEVNEKEGRAGHERMGTTLVMVLVQGAEAAVAHVGDSRLYQHARRSGLRQITTDHEVGQREMARGVPEEIAYSRPDAYQLTQALGPRSNDDLEPSVAYLSFSEDTLLLLCSDGLSDNNLVEDHLESHIDPILRGGKDIDTGMDELISLANEVNGHDNISAIAIRMKVSPDLDHMRKQTTTGRGLTVLQ
ncbi:MAG: serine/threonine phosphatase [Cyanobacteria bacterium P01_D01_bin.105]